MIETFEDMIELMHTYWGGDDEVHKDLDRLLELHNAQLEKWEEEHTDALYRAEMKGRADAVEKFAKWLPKHFDLRFYNNPDVWIDEYFNHTTEKYFKKLKEQMK